MDRKQLAWGYGFAIVLLALGFLIKYLNDAAELGHSLLFAGIAMTAFLVYWYLTGKNDKKLFKTFGSFYSIGGWFQIIAGSFIAIYSLIKPNFWGVFIGFAMIGVGRSMIKQAPEIAS